MENTNKVTTLFLLPKTNHETCEAFIHSDARLELFLEEKVLLSNTSEPKTNGLRFDEREKSFEVEVADGPVTVSNMNRRIFSALNQNGKLS